MAGGGWLSNLPWRRRPVDELASRMPKPVGAEGALVQSWHDPPLLVLYGYFLIASLLWLYWWLRRSSAFRRLHLLSSGTSTELSLPLLRGSRPHQQSFTDSSGCTVVLAGFTKCKLGNVARLSFPATSAVLLLWYCVMLVDYYWQCEIVWPEPICYIGTFPITGSYDAASKVFLILMALTATWFTFLVNWGSTIPTICQLPVPLASAEMIQVSVKGQLHSLPSGMSRVLAFWHTLLDRTIGSEGRQHRGLGASTAQVVPVRRDYRTGTRFVEFRCRRYSQDTDSGLFTIHSPMLLAGPPSYFPTRLATGGLSDREAMELLRQIGPNQIPFSVDSISSALVDEFATLFYVRQFCIYMMCTWGSYWHFVGFAVAITLGGGAFKIAVRLASQRQIHELVSMQTQVVVFRSGREQEVPSGDIVPGDIVRVGEGGWQVPCDLVLIQGSAICDESMLTGESMPVQRLSLSDWTGKQSSGSKIPSKHMLVGGTSVIQKNGGNKADVWAAALSTGAATQRGDLVMMTVYPPSLVFKYEEQLVVVFLLMSVTGCLIAYWTFSVLLSHAELQHVPWTALWTRAVFTMASTFPSMTHVALSAGDLASASRLKLPTESHRRHNTIFTCMPKRIALAGKVRVVCFDKTGTLTQSGLIFHGFHCMESGTNAEVPGKDSAAAWLESRAELAAHTSADVAPARLQLEPEPSQWPLVVARGLATAHSLSPLRARDGRLPEVIGSMVEKSMFEASRYVLETPERVVGPPSSAEPALEIMRRFDFSHETMTMSSVVRLPDGSLCAYCKGSFEHMRDICMPATLPSDYAKVAESHSKRGLYVLALAARLLAPETSTGLAALQRESVEQDLVFLGFLLFLNPIRPDTPSVLGTLRDAQVRSVMITGDAYGTAVHIARQAGLVSEAVPVILGDVQTSDEGRATSVVWRCVDEELSLRGKLLLDSQWLAFRAAYRRFRRGEGDEVNATLFKGQMEAQSSHGSNLDSIETWGRSVSWPSPNKASESQAGSDGEADVLATFTTEELVLSRLFECCELAVTQQAFNFLQGEPCPLELRRVIRCSRRALVQRGIVPLTVSGSIAAELLTQIRIFARMTPRGKVDVVEGLMGQQLITAMVGDGGNDCGALRSAHVGLALGSAASASAASVVAPFATGAETTAPICELLREGRAALATSFASYRFMIVTGLMNATWKITQVDLGVMASLPMCYATDIIGFVAFAWAMSFSIPSKTLKPSRPTSSLFSPTTVASVLGMVFIQVSVFRLGLRTIQRHPDYVRFPKHLVRMTEWWKQTRNWEVTTMFLMYVLEMYWMPVVFSFGSHWRRSWWRNKRLFAIWALSTAVMFGVLLGEPNSVTRWLGLAYEADMRHEPWLTLGSPCPALPIEVRVKLAMLLCADFALTACWERHVVFGRGFDVARRVFFAWSKHIHLTL